MASLVKERYGMEQDGESGEERVWNGKFEKFTLHTLKDISSSTVLC